MTDPVLSDAGCPGKWPRPLRLALDSIVTVLMNAYVMARSRATGSPSKIVRVLAERDEALWKLRLTERELEAQRRRIAAMASAKRPRFLQEDRMELLVLMRLRGWSIKKAAKRLVLHRNTLSRWRRKFLNGEDVGCFFGPAPFNTVGDAVRWLVHEMKDLCLDLGHGTRTIANMIVQAGIQLSRSSVQRILREKRPERPAKAAEESAPESDKPVPRHILLPKKPNRTWHLDLTVLSILGMRFHVAALLDGFSRKLLALKVYARTPTSIMMGALVRRTVERFGKARFLVVDHGCQFRTRFRTYVENTLGITPVSGKVRTYTFNGKAERFFRTFKEWARLVLFALLGNKKAMARSIQKHLQRYRSWFNVARVHQGIDGQTPEQAWSGSGLPAAKIVRARDPQPDIRISRRTFDDDPHLPVIGIEVEWAEAA